MSSLNKGIVKVQIPIVSTDPNPKALIYNKDRSIEVFCPLAHVSELPAARRGELRFFVWAALDEAANTIFFYDEAEEQVW